MIDTHIAMDVTCRPERVDSGASPHPWGTHVSDGAGLVYPRIPMDIAGGTGLVYAGVMRVKHGRIVDDRGGQDQGDLIAVFHSSLLSWVRG
ncbi:MAG: hypothetical protein PHT19_17045 [Methylococcus sp.]|nr:hypothetical protein [Methylococcus sp.]